MQTAIKTERLSKTYGNRRAIDNISLSVKCGTVFGLLGANGAGKSTTIECILGTKPAFDGAEYTFLEQSFGALCTVSICAGDLMGLPLVVSEYRERTILKRFQVTPVSPLKLHIVEFSVYVVYCIVSMLTLIPTAMLIWKVRIIGYLPAFLGSWLLTMVSTLSIGMMVGGVAKIQKAQVLLPAFFTSRCFFRVRRFSLR